MPRDEVAERRVQEALETLTFDRAIEIEEGAPATEYEREALRRWGQSMAPVRERLAALARAYEGSGYRRLPARQRRRFARWTLSAYLVHVASQRSPRTRPGARTPRGRRLARRARARAPGRSSADDDPHHDLEGAPPARFRAEFEDRRRSTGALEALANAEAAVRDDPVRLAAESAERECSRRLWRALVLAPTVEIAEALLRGEAVPLDRLDREWVTRLGRRTP